jgi:hypothetical protein
MDPLQGRGGGAAQPSGAGGVRPDAGGTPAPAAPPANRGELLEFVAGTGDVPYAIGENPYGIRGSGFLARSALGNTIVVADEPGKICISGNLEEVPNGDYNGYWGVEIGFNLQQEPAGSVPGAAGAAPPGADVDAGVDAGPDSGLLGDAAAPADVVRPWLPGNVVGFSYVIEGPTIDLIRFKALPEGFDSTQEASVFCKTVNAVSGTAEDSLFTQMTQYCWGSTTVPLPTQNGLDNISWQLPADVAPTGARPFDWCLSELRPILAE